MQVARVTLWFQMSPKRGLQKTWDTEYLEQIVYSGALC